MLDAARAMAELYARAVGIGALRGDVFVGGYSQGGHAAFAAADRHAAYAPDVPLRGAIGYAATTDVTELLATAAYYAPFVLLAYRSTYGPRSTRRGACPAVRREPRGGGRQLLRGPRAAGLPVRRRRHVHPRVPPRAAGPRPGVARAGLRRARSRRTTPASAATASRRWSSRGVRTSSCATPPRSASSPPCAPRAARSATTTCRRRATATRGRPASSRRPDLAVGPRQRCRRPDDCRPYAVASAPDGPFGPDHTSS
jgi:hypothetical protein